MPDLNPVRMPIRKAADGDIGAMIDMRSEAEEWLQANGITQWTDDYHEQARDVLRAAVQAGHAYVVEDTGRVVATVSLVPVDLDFWGWMPAPDRDNAVYLAKMIVARSHSGRGIGAAIVNWAGRRAAAAGKTWVRLDCRRDNTRLHAFYERLGFEHLRTWHAPSRRTNSGWLGHRPAAAHSDTAVVLRDEMDHCPCVG